MVDPAGKTGVKPRGCEKRESLAFGLYAALFNLLDEADFERAGGTFSSHCLRMWLIKPTSATEANTAADGTKMVSAINISAATGAAIASAPS